MYTRRLVTSASSLRRGNVFKKNQIPQRFKSIASNNSNGGIVPAEEPKETSLVPINFDEAATIEGAESQIVHVELKPNQELRAETGSMLYMTSGVEIETSTAGGFGAGFKRMMTGENFFVSHFKYTGPQASGTVAFGTDFPSKIIRLPLKKYGGSIICQQGAFLCGSSTIDIEMEFTKKFSVGFFGGEGFILQRLTGDGDAFVKASGALIEKDLGPGEVLRISTGCLVAFEPSVSYDITTMSGFKNVVFGGEGLFITTLTGPGKVFLQGMPTDRIVDQIARRIPRGGAGGGFMPIPMGGGSGGAEEAAGDAGGIGAAAAAEAAVGGAGADESSIYGADDSSSTSTTSSFEDSNNMPQGSPDPFDTGSGGGSEEIWDASTGVDSSSGVGDDDDSGVVDTVKDIFNSIFGNNDD